LQRNDGARQQNLVVLVVLRKRSSQRKQGFSCSRNTCERNELNVGVHQYIHGKGLFGVAWLNAVSADFIYALQPVALLVVGGKGVAVAALEQKVLVGARFQLQRSGIKPLATCVQRADLLGCHLYHFGILFNLVNVLYLPRKVVLRVHTQRFRLHAQIYIFAYQYGGTLRVAVFFV